MDNTKVLCYSPNSDISPVSQNLQEGLIIHMIAACKVLFLLLLFSIGGKKLGSVWKQSYTQEGSFYLVTCAVCWLDGFTEKFWNGYLCCLLVVFQSWVTKTKMRTI